MSNKIKLSKADFEDMLDKVDKILEEYQEIDYYDKIVNSESDFIEYAIEMDNELFDALQANEDVVYDLRELVGHLEVILEMDISLNQLLNGGS